MGIPLRRQARPQDVHRLARASNKVLVFVVRADLAGVRQAGEFDANVGDRRRRLRWQAHGGC